MRPLKLVRLAVVLATAFVAFVMARTAHAAPGTRTLYLVRHGIYDRDTTVDDHVGNGLNAMGREQAAITGKFLAKLPVKYTRFVSSTLKRAMDTADIMAGDIKLTPERDSLLNECSPTSFDDNYNRMAKSEEHTAADAQLNAAWAKYATPSPDGDTADLLVFHGNALRWFVARAVAGDGRRWSTMDIANCSLTVITIRPDGTPKLVMYSDLGELPVEKQTWSGKGAGWKVGAAAGAAKGMK